MHKLEKSLRKITRIKRKIDRVNRAIEKSGDKGIDPRLLFITPDIRKEIESTIYLHEKGLDVFNGYETITHPEEVRLIGGKNAIEKYFCIVIYGRGSKMFFRETIED